MESVRVALLRVPVKILIETLKSVFLEKRMTLVHDVGARYEEATVRLLPASSLQSLVVDKLVSAKQQQS